MARVTVLVGLPASGKSSYAEEQKKMNKDLVIISSDSIREMLLGSVDEQSANDFVFDIVHKAIIQNLKMGKNVIFDATNIDRKRRVAFVKNVNAYVKEAYVDAIFFATPFDTCIYRNERRDRVVPMHVMYRMYTQMTVPTSDEGFGTVFIRNTQEFINYQTIDYDRLIDNYVDEDTFYSLTAGHSIFFDGIDGIEHNNKWHLENVGKHIYNVYGNIFKTESIMRNELIIAALMHDVGKKYTKMPSPKIEGQSVYYNHENVSQYIATVMSINFPKYVDKDFIFRVVKYHMLAHNNLDLAKTYFHNEMEKSAFEEFVEADRNGSENVQ
jgi:predicted kinase